MPDEPPPAASVPVAASAARRLFGMILLVLGILLTVASGLCPGVMFFGLLLTGDGGESGPSGVAMAGLPIMVGGPFILIGWLMWWGGNKLRRGPQPLRATETRDG